MIYNIPYIDRLLFACGENPRAERFSVMKKTIAALLALILAASCFVVFASAKPFAVSVGDIQVPFEISDEWYVSALGNIDPGFWQGNDLTTRYFNRFMYSFGYVLWLKHKKTDNEIILVRNEAEAGQRDYSALSDAELNGILSAQRALLPEGLDAQVKATKFTSGGVVFLRTESEITGLVSAVYYATVFRGEYFEVRLNAINDPISAAAVSQQDAIVNDLAAALTFPASYPSAPETTLPEGLDEEQVFDLAQTTALPQVSGAAEPSAQQSAVSSSAPAQQTPSEKTDADETDIDAVTGPQTEPLTDAASDAAFSLEEYVPAAEKPAAAIPYWAYFVAAAVIVFAVAAVVVLRRKRR